jgi:hypothetical protein
VTVTWSRFLIEKSVQSDLDFTLEAIGNMADERKNGTQESCEEKPHRE